MANTNNGGLSEFKKLVQHLDPVIRSIVAEKISQHVDNSRLDEDNTTYARSSSSEVKHRGPAVGGTSKVAAPARNASASMSDSEVTEAREGVMAARSIRTQYAKSAADAVMRKRGKGETANYSEELRRVYSADPLGIGVTHAELMDLSDSPEACQVMAQTPTEHDADLMERATYSRRAAAVVLKSREPGNKPISFEAALNDEMRKVKYAKSRVPGYWKGSKADYIPPAINWNEMDADVQRRARIAAAARDECLSRRGLGEVVSYNEIFERMLGGNEGPGDGLAGAVITRTRGTAAAAALYDTGSGLGSSSSVRPVLGPLLPGVRGRAG